MYVARWFVWVRAGDWPGAARDLRYNRASLFRFRFRV